MNLNDIYPHGFPPCFIPTELKIFKIPIKNCFEYVYMKPNNMYPNYNCVNISSELFADIWGDSANTGPEKWAQDWKLQNRNIKSYFDEGIINPVPLAVVARIQNNKLYLADGTTRTLWLLVNGAKAFPLSCPPEYTKELIKLAGIEQKELSIISSYPRINNFCSTWLEKLFACMTKILKK